MALSRRHSDKFGEEAFKSLCDLFCDDLKDVIPAEKIHNNFPFFWNLFVMKLQENTAVKCREILILNFEGFPT